MATVDETTAENLRRLFRTPNSLDNLTEMKRATCLFRTALLRLTDGAPELDQTAKKELKLALQDTLERAVDIGEGRQRQREEAAAAAAKINANAAAKAQAKRNANAANAAAAAQAAAKRNANAAAAAQAAAQAAKEKAATVLTCDELEVDGTDCDVYQDNLDLLQGYKTDYEEVAPNVDGIRKAINSLVQKVTPLREHMYDICQKVADIINNLSDEQQKNAALYLLADRVIKQTDAQNTNKEKFVFTLVELVNVTAILIDNDELLKLVIAMLQERSADCIPGLPKSGNPKPVDETAVMLLAALHQWSPCEYYKFKNKKTIGCDDHVDEDDTARRDENENIVDSISTFLNSVCSLPTSPQIVYILDAYIRICGFKLHKIVDEKKWQGFVNLIHETVEKVPNAVPVKYFKAKLLSLIAEGFPTPPEGRTFYDTTQSSIAISKK